MTDNHQFTTQTKGAQDWHIPLNETIEELDREVPVRDAESNLNDYTPKEEALFIATDTGAVYSGDGSSWYLESWAVSDFEATDSITFPDGTTVTSPGSGSAVDFEEGGSTVVQNASAADFIASGAATVTVTDDGDGTVTIEVSASDTNTERTDEEIQDVVAALVGGGDNITTSYDDPNDAITIDGLTDEEIQDLVGAMAGTNITYDDGSNQINADASQRTDEEIEDVVGALITSGTNTTVTYDDAANAVVIDAIDTNLTDEEVQDIIGGILDGTLYYDDVNNLIGVEDNSISTSKLSFDTATQAELDTHAGVTDAHHVKYTDEEAQDAVGTILTGDFDYDDVSNTIDLSSNTVTIAGNQVALGGSTAIAHGDLNSISAADHHTRYADEEAQDAVGTILGSNFSYSDSTPSINLASDEVTIAGNPVSLGGSISIAHADLNSITADAHHTRYTDQESQDSVGSIFGSTLSYDTTAPSMNVAADSLSQNELSLPLSVTLSTLIGAPVDLGGADLSDNSTTVWNSSASELVGDINSTLADIDRLFIPDTGLTGLTTNGTLWNEGGDIFAYVNGTEVKLSDIGTGSGGAAEDAPYLTTASDATLTNETVVSNYPFDQNDLGTDSVGSDEIQSNSVGNDELKDTVTSGESESVTISGDGTKTFALSHSLGAQPSAVVVEPSSKAASTDFWISGGDSTQVEITYAIAPPSGTDNLSYNLSTGAGDPSSYTDSDAVNAVNSDTDHGSTAQHDYFSENPSDLNQDGATVDDLLSWDGSQWNNIPSSTFLASDGTQSLSGNWDVGGFALSNVSALDTGRLSFDQPEETVVSGTTGSTYTIDVTNGSVFDLTLDADVTFSFTGGASAAGANSVTVILTQDGTGGRGVTWPGETQWSGGSEPSLSTAADATDIVTFVSPDQGTTWYGFLGGLAFA